LLKAVLVVYPIREAISLISHRPSASKAHAFCMRHSSKYWRGGLETMALNRAANVDRDRHTRSASAATVQGHSRLACMSFKTGPMSGSMIAASQWPFSQSRVLIHSRID